MGFLLSIRIGDIGYLKGVVFWSCSRFKLMGLLWVVWVNGLAPRKSR